MKILHFITSLKFGGAESALYNYLAQAVCDRTNEHVVAYIYYGQTVELIKNLDIPVFQISGCLFKYSPVTFIRFLLLVNRIKPDIIHTSLWSAGFIAKVFRKFIHIPLVCDIHGSSFDEGKFRNFLDRCTVKFPDKIVVVSDSVKHCYIKNIVLKIKPKHCQRNIIKNIVTIKNGIDCQKLVELSQRQALTRSNFGLNENDFVVGAVGRLEPIKSYDVLVKAFAQFYKLHRLNANGLKLFIVGGGRQLLVLKQLARVLGIDQNVIFTGSRIDAYAFYSLFDCFALSSKSEGLSVALLEAMSFGLPIISTNSCQKHDVIKHTVNGLLVETGSVDMYATAIETIFLQPELRKQMSIYNFNMILNEFAITKVVEKYNEIYTDIKIKKYPG